MTSVCVRDRFVVRLGLGLVSAGDVTLYTNRPIAAFGLNALIY